MPFLVRMNRILDIGYVFAGWRSLLCAMLTVATAMLCKEQGITITGICVVYELFVAQKVCSQLTYLFCASSYFTNLQRVGNLSLWFKLFQNNKIHPYVNNRNRYLFPTAINTNDFANSLH